MARAAAYAAPEQTACGIAHVEVLRFGRRPPQAPLSNLRTLQDARQLEYKPYLSKIIRNTRAPVSNKTHGRQAL